MCEIIDISPGNLDSSLCFIQSSISHDVLCKVNQTGWQYTALMYSFPNLEPVHGSMSSSNCCFLTCTEISHEAGKVVWYLFKKFPQFAVIHTVKGFGIVNKVDVSLELSCFFDDPTDAAIWCMVTLSFLNPPWTSGSSQSTYCWSLNWRILSATLLVCKMSPIVQ